MTFMQPGKEGSAISFSARYENFIGGEWVAPVDGRYFENISPVTGQSFCEVPRSSAADVELAVDVALKAQVGWGSTPAAARSYLLLQIADRIEANIEKLAVAETWDNGKAIREGLAADIPLAVDHFRYFAGCLRAQDSGMAEIDSNTLSYHVYEPLGVVGAIIPWNFPILMATWKLAPALAAGNCIVMKPAEQTPVSILILMEILADLLPPGTVNIVNGYGAEAGDALARNKRIAKIAFTGSTPVGHHILRRAADNMIPSTVELGGKAPNIYFNDIMDFEEEYLNKAIEGSVLAFFNQGQTCTCPSRILIQEDIYEPFMERVIERTQQIKRGSPLDPECMVGAQASREQYDKILNYINIGNAEGAEVLIGGEAESMQGDLASGFYIKPTVLKGSNKMRVFQEEIFGPVVGVTTFKTEEEALSLANDTDFGLSAGVWTRDINRAYRMARGIKAGRVWTNCYHVYPAHAAFGGYKKSGIGREGHKVTLEHYQITKNILVSHDTNPLGFF